MAGSRAVQQWKEAMAPGGGDSDDEEMMKEECKKNLKLMKKMKKDLAVSGKGKGEIEWQRESDVQHTQWGVDFGFQRGMLMGIGINVKVRAGVIKCRATKTRVQTPYAVGEPKGRRKRALKESSSL
ncbi:hypothetical protein GJAV_G00248570 [Gymnothorax javanicus]|nr:hypothetical protein GJAV_G00248570 [Gymnothorax javanicus]